MTASAPNKHLILGAALGYDAKQLRPFVMSLNETGYEGETVLLVSPSKTESGTIESLRSWGVTVEPFETWRLMSVCMHFARHVKYLEFLMENPGYDYILLADTRDIVFQNDPFCLDQSRSLYFFTESETVKIGNCASNSTWIEAGFGKAKLQSLFHKTISCSGTVMGSHDGIMAYLSAMIVAASKADAQSLTVEGIDQGFHNIILHDKLIADIHLMKNQGHIATLGHLGPDDISLSEDGRAINADGTASPIVHQYDYPSHDALYHSIMKRYARP